MKRTICTITVICILLCTLAYAATQDYGMILDWQEGAYATSAVKDSSTGAKAILDVNYKDVSTASMYYQIRKMDGVGASNELITTATGSFNIAYKKDGNGNSLGRHGYTYKLRVAHRTQSSYHGQVVTDGEYTP